jgi:hypothetical protein
MIFISHAEADKSIIDDFYDLFQMGCDLRREEILCTSVDGAGIRTGDDFVDWVHKYIETSNLIVLFITPNYLASRFCVAEMGAAWALQKEVFPLLLPTVERDVGGVMLGRQTAVVDESGLDDLRDRIATLHPMAAQGTGRWSIKKEEFLAKFRAKILGLPAPLLVDRSQLEHEKERTAAAMKMNHQLTEENKRLREQIALLESTKDRADVERIKAKFIPEEKRFSILVEKVNERLNKLSPIEVRCVYSSIRGELWVASSDCRKEYGVEIGKAKESEWILEPKFALEDGALTANRDHPRLRSVFEGIDELDNFIGRELSEEAKTRMEEQKECLVDVRNRQFWEEILYQRPMWD